MSTLRSTTVLQRITILAAIATCWIATRPVATSAEPGWSPVVIPTGQYRSHIKSMPIEHRPYRPFHFYGNTVRRNYYRTNSPQSRVVVPQQVRGQRPPLMLFPAAN